MAGEQPRGRSSGGGKTNLNLHAIDEMQVVASGVIQARPTVPPKMSKIRTRVQQVQQENSVESSNQTADRKNEDLDRRAQCESILTAGYVQAYIDFFYLTHRPGPIQDNLPPGQNQGEIDVPPVEMTFIKDSLVAAEGARREGDTETVYKSFNALAQYFQDVKDTKTGVYFYEKCLELSRLVSDKKGEMMANCKLGLVHYKMGETDAAMKFHERQQDLARSVDSAEEIASSAKELLKVYRKCAEAKEEEGDFSSAIELWQKSHESSRTAQDREAEGIACYHLGTAWVELGEPLRAVQYLEDYEHICKELSDLEGQGSAYAALAAAYQALGDDEKALSFLVQNLGVASRTNNLPAQADACRSLGALHFRRGDHKKALDMFTRKFSIISTSGEATTTVAPGGSQRPGKSNASAVDTARCYLGMAKGSEMLGAYIRAVNGDLKQLLEWKCTRVKPT